MLPGFAPIQIGLVLAALLAVGYVWLLAGRGKWYAFLSKRFLYGVPWGTAVSIAGVIGFYLIAQSGFSNWGSPVTLPFRSWSYFYPEGLLVSGFAHASPSHLIGNMAGTLVLAPIVEYAWSHYPPKRADSEYEYPPPAAVGERTITPDYAGNERLHNPWVRAFVIFPGAVFVISILTSVFAFGWSLGFSGTVFAFGGFAVVYFPLAAIIAMVAFTGTSIAIIAFQEPILRATATPGAPGPPGWWGVNVQAHLLGFLIGVVLAVMLLKYRDEYRRPEWVFFAALIFGLSRQLYAFSASGGTTDGGVDVFLQLRAVGVIFVVALAVVITATVVADDRPLPNPFDVIPWTANHRLVAALWIGAVVVIGWIVWTSTIGDGNISPLLIAFAPVLFLLLLLPGFRVAGGTPRRRLLMVALSITIVVVALPSLASNLPGMSDDPVPEGETLSIDDYEIAYAEDADHGRIGTTDSGVIVVNEQRQIWSAVVDKEELEHDGVTTVPVGGFAWREAVTATRTGWEVVGADVAYAVDLEHDSDSLRAFASEQVEAASRIDGQRIAVEPTTEEFRLNITSGDERIGTAPIPEENESTVIGELTVSTERIDGTLSVFVESADSRILIAEQERYD